MYYGKFARDVVGLDNFSETFDCIKSVEILYDLLRG